MKIVFATFLCVTGIVAHAQDPAPNWHLEGNASWQARDSQAEYVFHDQL